MASYTRQQLESWLKTIEVDADSVIDIGGSAKPVKDRTKTWRVSNYKILDKNYSYKRHDIVQDLNRPFELSEKFSVAFCLEVMEYMWNPYQAVLNINNLLNSNGWFYLSTHFMFPHHGGGTDCVRFTRSGIECLLTTAGFRIIKIVPRVSVDPKTIIDWSRRESKICRFIGEIGHLVEAQKL